MLGDFDSFDLQQVREENVQVFPARKDYTDSEIALMHALALAVNVGCARETFALNQLRSAGHEVTYPPQGDFLVDGRCLFEVGGAGKGFDQIKDVPDSFVLADDMETGFGNKIPLWLFGFLY